MQEKGVAFFLDTQISGIKQSPTEFCMKPREPYKTDVLSKDRSVPETVKSSAGMAGGTMDIYADPGRKPRAPVVANRYNARYLRDKQKQTPEAWILECLDGPSTVSRHVSVGGELFPEYSIPVRFLDAEWSQVLTLGALKLVHFIFATCIAEDSSEVTIRKRALSAFLAKSKGSLSTSFAKESISVLKKLSVTIGVRSMLNERARVAPTKIEKVFADIREDKDGYRFRISDKVADEFAKPKIFVPIGLNVIQRFTSLHSMLLFTVMMGDLTIDYRRHAARKRSSLAKIWNQKHKAMRDGHDVTEWIHVPKWEPRNHRIKLDVLGDLICLPADSVNRQLKRIQKRVIDASERIDAVFQGEYIGPKVTINEEYGAATVRERRNLATTSGVMELTIRAPWRPAQYEYTPKDLLKILTLETSTDLYVSPLDFKNALAVAGFDSNDPELAKVIHVDWKTYLYNNRDKVEAGVGVGELFLDYYEGLVDAGKFCEFDELGLPRKVGQWWAQINGIEAELEEAVREIDTAKPNEASKTVPSGPDRKNLPPVLEPTSEEASVIELFDVYRNPDEPSKVIAKVGRGDMTDFLISHNIRVEAVPYMTDAEYKRVFGKRFL